MSPQQTNEEDNAGLGIGVVQPQSGLDYPFVSPGLNANPTYLLDVRELFADFYLSYDDRGHYWSESVNTNPLRVYWLYGFGDGPAFSQGLNPVPEAPIPSPTHAKDLIVVDSQNRVVFDSTQADEYDDTTIWGDHYRIIEWRRNEKPTNYQRQQRTICRVVQFLHLHTNTPIPERPVSFCPRHAVLDERTIEKIPKRVLAMRVQTGNCVSEWFHDKVTFVNGHNTELTIGESATLLSGVPSLTTSLRKNTNIGFRVAAGAGKGQYGICATGVCEEDTPTGVCDPGQDVNVNICNEEPGESIKTLNGVSPDKNGNISLNATDCLFVRKPATYINNKPQNTYMVNGQEVRPVMHIGGDCGPCCACEDYVETAKYLTKIAQQYGVVGERVTDTQNLHQENIQRWNDQRDCRLSKPLRLLLVTQPCPCIDVVAMYCNQCNDCAENVRLTISFSSSPAGGSGTIDPRYTELVGAGYSVPAVVNGGWPIFSANFPTVKSGASVYVKFRLCFCPAYPYAIQGNLTGVKSTGAILAGCEGELPIAIATANQILDCEI
jgi:hypothetical protein